MTELFTILVGDAREQLDGLPEDSVHSVVTSPPYYSLRDYGFPEHIGLEDDFTCWGWAHNLHRVWQGFPADRGDDRRCGRCHTCVMTNLFRQVRRVLHPSGSVWLNYGDRYNSYPHNQKHGAMHAHADYPKLGGGLIDPTRKNKEILFMPQIVALALQADGWWVFSNTIWWKSRGDDNDDGKGNAKPESVTHRPIATCENVFMLAKRERGTYYDHHAVRTPYKESSIARFKSTRRGLHHGEHQPGHKPRDLEGAQGQTNVGALLRNVWTIPAGKFAGNHTATFPVALPERCILAGTSAKGACPECLSPWVRLTENGEQLNDETYRGSAVKDYAELGGEDPSEAKRRMLASQVEHITIGWAPTCECNRADTVPSVVLDPFAGMMSTGIAALKHARRFIGIEGSAECAVEGQARLKAETAQQVMRLA